MSGEQPIDSEYRTKAIIEYISKNQGCNKQDVVNFCTENGFATRNPVMNILKDLENEGLLTVSKKKNNSKALILTIDSKDLRLILPRQFERLLLLFKVFINELKKWCEHPHIMYHHRWNKSFYDLSHENIIGNATLLAYDLIDVITDTYSMYFIFILPKKLCKEEHLTTLYAIYFKFVGQVYSLIGDQLKNYLPEYDLQNFNKSIVCKQYLNSKRQNQNWKTIRTVAASREMSLSKEVFHILEFVWQNNYEVVSAIYKKQLELGQYISGSDKKVLPDKKVLFEDEYRKIKDPVVEEIYTSILDIIEINYNSNIEDNLYHNS